MRTCAKPLELLASLGHIQGQPASMEFWESEL